MGCDCNQGLPEFKKEPEGKSDGLPRKRETWERKRNGCYCSGGGMGEVERKTSDVEAKGGCTGLKERKARRTRGGLPSKKTSEGKEVGAKKRDISRAERNCLFRPPGSGGGKLHSRRTRLTHSDH